MLLPRLLQMLLLLLRLPPRPLLLRLPPLMPRHRHRHKQQLPLQGLTLPPHRLPPQTPLAHQRLQARLHRHLR